MTLEECFEKAGRKFPFLAKHNMGYTVQFEAQLSNKEFIGVHQSLLTRHGKTDGDEPCSTGWTLIEPGKPRVFRWEVRYVDDGWADVLMFMTEERAAGTWPHGHYRKSRLHGTVYPAEGWADE